MIDLIIKVLQKENGDGEEVYNFDDYDQNKPNDSESPTEVLTKALTRLTENLQKDFTPC